MEKETFESEIVEKNENLNKADELAGPGGDRELDDSGLEEGEELEGSDTELYSKGDSKPSEDTLLETELENQVKTRKRKKKAKKVKFCNLHRRSEKKLLDILVEENGWKEVNTPEKADYTHLSNNCYIDDFRIGCHTLINRIPGISNCALKRVTTEIMNEYRVNYMNGINQYFPESYLMPEQYTEYKKAHKAHPHRTYISKISQGSQGYGIKLLKAPKDLSLEHFNAKMNDQIVQRYLPKPFLLERNPKKHDLRIYVLYIAKTKPKKRTKKKKNKKNGGQRGGRIGAKNAQKQQDEPQHNPEDLNGCQLYAYIHKEGLARFCTEEYQEPSKKNKANDAIHLTNYSLNKHNSEYVFVNEEDVLKDFNGSKRCMESYWKGVQKNSNGAEIKKRVLTQVPLLVQHLTQAIQPFIFESLKYAFSKHTDRFKCFHVLGVDILVDENGDCWLLEINSNPSLNVMFDPDDWKAGSGKEYRESVVSPVDKYVKTSVLGEAVELSLKPLSKLKKLRFYKGYTQVYLPSMVQGGPSDAADMEAINSQALGTAPTKYHFTLPYNVKAVSDGSDPFSITLLPNIFNKLFGLFLHLSSVRFKAVLGMQRFSKLALLFKHLRKIRPNLAQKAANLTKMDIDLVYSKVIVRCPGGLSFDAFVIAVAQVLERWLYPKEMMKEWERRSCAGFKPDEEPFGTEEERFAAIEQVYLEDARPLTRLEMFELMLYGFNSWRDKITTL